ncbi:MAG: hypothetical protein J5367_02260 [Lachnospiraceae bacterium]|nr:hypothetical protein [Lachnospiraceae bacterium]
MDRFRKSFSVFFSLAVLAAVIICFLIMNDTGTTAALCWLAVVFSVSFFMRPFIPLRNLKFPDAGFGICFGAGLFLCFYFTWTVCAVFSVPYSSVTAYIAAAFFAAAGFVIRKFVVKEEYITPSEFSGLLRGFAIFAVIFLLFFWVIGFNPLVDSGTENYMDFGFMQTIFRQKAAIPEDPWFSGTRLNYYFLGQSASVFMCFLANTTPEYGYNFMLITFIGMVFVMVYEIVYALADALIGDVKRGGTIRNTAATVGAALAAFAGNPHWFLSGIIGAGIGKLFTDDYPSYWFCDGTVYISTEAGDSDNGKNEFPAYSVILGDLHAHVINLIFVLPLVAILFDLALSDKDKKNRLSGIYALTFISMLLGYYKGANYWDFAIYFVITGAVIVFTDISRSGLSVRTVLDIAVKAVFVFAVSFVTIIPFTLGFDKMESGIALADMHSPIFKLAVLWFIPFAVAVGLLVSINLKKYKGLFKNHVANSALTAFILCTMGLVITPEFVYVIDIYGETNSRFNTMFKLTYQAYTLFAIIMGLAFAVALWRMMYGSAHRGSARAACIFLAVYCALSVLYSPHSIKDWYGDVLDSSRRIGISSLAGLRNDEVYGFEMTAADLLMEDDRRNLHIIEAAGDSYTHQSALSVYTGACTPIGWFVHEWMWHNDADPVRERADGVNYFFCSGNEEYCRNYIKEHEIDYIFVGPAEVCKYPVNRNGFWRLGEVCCETIWQDQDLALIKVDRSKL